MSFDPKWNKERQIKIRMLTRPSTSVIGDYYFIHTVGTGKIVALKDFTITVQFGRRTYQRWLAWQEQLRLASNKKIEVLMGVPPEKIAR